MLAAVDDIAGCFWVHQKKVVIAGYASGGISVYRVGLKNADRFAGIVIEDEGLYGTGAADALLATRRAPRDFRSSRASLPVAGTHDGTSTDWAAWLVAQSAGFVAP